MQDLLKQMYQKITKNDLDKVTKLINDNVDPSTGEEYTSEKLKELQDRKTEIENKNDTVYGFEIPRIYISNYKSNSRTFSKS